MSSTVLPRRVASTHLLSIIAIVLALAAPAGAALVTATGIANNAIDSRHIRNGRITAADLAAKSVTSRQLAIGAVKAQNLAKGSIGANQVADGSLTGADLVDGSVSALDLAPGAVGASALAAGSIGASLITDGGVGAADLADGAVTSGKIATGAVTGSKLGDLSVTSGKLADGAVTTTKFASGAVDASAIGTGAVTSAKFATGAVDETAIGAGAVDSIELANDAVGSQHMSAGSVRGGALGTVVGVGVTATNVAVAQDAFEDAVTDELDGQVVDFTSELFDTATMHDNVTNPSLLVAPITGLYQVQAWVSWTGDATGYREAAILANGAIVSQDRRLSGSGGMARLPNQQVSVLVALSAADSITLRLSNNAGVAITADRVRVTMHRVGTSA